MSLNTLTIEFARTLKQNINIFAEESGLTPEEYVRNIVKKEIDLKRYGDINERLNNIKLKGYSSEDENLVIDTNFGKIKIPLNELLKCLNIKEETQKKSIKKTKQKDIVKTEENNTEVTENNVQQIVSRRNQRIL